MQFLLILFGWEENLPGQAQKRGQQMAGNGFV
jgi:hypothetical protein